MKKNLWLVTAGAHLCNKIWLRKVIRPESFPQRGKVIFAANHSSLLDGIIMTTQLNWMRHAPTHTIADQTPFEHWFMGYILRSARCIPFERCNDESTTKMLQMAIGYLKRDEAIGIFPEGHLNNGKSLRLPRPGAALLALESGAPIIPIGLRGTYDAFPVGHRPKLFSPVTMHIGDPIDTADLSANYHNSDKEARQYLISGLSSQIMECISELSGLTPHRRMKGK